MKYFMGLIVCLLLVGAAQTHIVKAASSPELSADADQNELTEGEYVNIKVGLTNNPSISTLGAALSYDNSILKYESTSWNSSFSDNDMKMATDTGSEVNLSVVCDNEYSMDGTVATVRFQAMQDTSDIPVSLTLRDMTDASMAAVSDGQVADGLQTAETDGNEEQGTEPDTVLDEEWTDAGQEDEYVEDEDWDDEDTSLDEEQEEEISQENFDSDIWNDDETEDLTADTGNGAASDMFDEGLWLDDGAGYDSSELDQNYQTDAGLGNDIYLVLAVVFGIFALVLAARGLRKKSH